MSDFQAPFPLSTLALAAMSGTRVRPDLGGGRSVLYEITISLEKIIFIQREEFKALLFEPKAGHEVVFFINGTRAFMQGCDILLCHPFEEVEKKFRRYLDIQQERV